MNDEAEKPIWLGRLGANLVRRLGGIGEELAGGARFQAERELPSQDVPEACDRACFAERACWTRCARAGNAFSGTLTNDVPVGLLVMDRIDGIPYLEQVSVRRAAMGQGLGRRLLETASNGRDGSRCG